MDEIEKNVCLKFVPRTNEINYVTIVDFPACASPVGNQNIGPQVLYLMIGQGIGSKLVSSKNLQLFIVTIFRVHMFGQSNYHARTDTHNWAVPHAVLARSRRLC